MGQGRGERRRRKRERPLAFSFHPLPHRFLVGHLFSFRATLLPTFTNHKRRPLGSTPGNACWGCAARFSISWPYFRQKNVIFRTRFQTWPLKSIPVFRSGGDHKTQHKHWHETVTMSSSATKTFLKIHFEFAYYTFFLIQLEFWNDEHIDTPPQFLRKLYPIPDQKWAKCIPVFQTKTEQKPYPMVRHIPTCLL